LSSEAVFKLKLVAERKEIRDKVRDRIKRCGWLFSSKIYFSITSVFRMIFFKEKFPKSYFLDLAPKRRRNRKCRKYRLP
jgi:hypothetical protein